MNIVIDLPDNFNLENEINTVSNPVIRKALKNGTPFPEPCDRLKLDGMLEDAYEHGYQQARYDYEVQPCDAVSREAVLDILKQECSEIEQFLAKQIRELPSVHPIPVMYYPQVPGATPCVVPDYKDGWRLVE